ncbi:neurosecretory protein VGF [Antennarius striatus]|uniref:neurosecretory protein VGF n=1 Tax=Antennarius striatus TaxID=241820 RepID=UPI0035B27721
MIGYHDASSALTLLVLLMGASALPLSSPNQINTTANISSPQRNSLPELLESEDRRSEDEERRSLQRGGTEEEEELFKDVDPKTLAAVLLEALNQSRGEGQREGEEHDGTEGYVKAEEREVGDEERVVEESDRGRDGRRELELMMASQRRDQEEEERQTAEEEEEKMTEKVTSRTVSQTVQVQTHQQNSGPTEEGENEQGASPQQGPNGPEEEEEQLNPEELKNLETMMKEFPCLSTPTKREGKPNERESRGYSSFNDVVPAHKDLALSKKKLKWQEETQKALSFPTFKENFMDVFEEGNDADGNAAQSQSPVDEDMEEDDEPGEEEEEEEEEVLSPEEEEARAKVEQEEMRRQAAEAQRARMKEEKLADIASDMLLRYMVRQNKGNRKYSSTISNTVEDKRSDEEQVTEEEDIDPQTIDKLIEISSKLHLPADDVVDIISDVEKKKKKDVPPEVASRWQRPPGPLSSAFSSSRVSANRNSLPVSRQPSFSPLQRIQEASPAVSQVLWNSLARPPPWSKPQQRVSTNQELWVKPPQSGYLFYRYPPYYQRKPYLDHQPIYFPSPPRPKPRYYIPKPAHTLDSWLGYPVGDPYAFPPRRRYHSWVAPWLNKSPVGLQQKPYYRPYPLPLYTRTFQPMKPRSPPQIPAVPPQQMQVYFSPPAPQATRNEGYFRAAKQPDGNRDNLEKYIQQMLMKRPQI